VGGWVGAQRVRSRGRGAGQLLLREQEEQALHVQDSCCMLACTCTPMAGWCHHTEAVPLQGSAAETGCSAGVPTNNTPCVFSISNRQAQANTQCKEAQRPGCKT
jgi:hypothetical protein